MKSLIVLSWFFAMGFFAFGQDSASALKAYKMVVFKENGQLQSGYVKQVSDTTLILVPRASFLKKPLDPAHAQVFSYNEVNKIHMTRKGAVGKGAAMGALIGFAAGALAGFIIGDDPPCNESANDFLGIGYALCEGFRTTAAEKALFLGAGGGISGVTIGICIGALSHKKFLIKGKRENFRDMQLYLRPQQ